MSEGAKELLCDTLNCGKVSKLRCPTCIKANIKEGSNFCSQVNNSEWLLGVIQFLFVWRYQGMFYQILECAQAAASEQASGL